VKLWAARTGSCLHPAGGVAEHWLAISRQALWETAYVSALTAGRRLTLERAVEEIEQIAASAIERFDRTATGFC
jgi:hypothetical protein